MTHRFLGIDGGGTKTASVILDGDGTEMARAIGGPSNYQSVGRTVAEQSLRDVIHQVLSSAHLVPADVNAIGLGMAGVDRPVDHAVMRDILSRIGSFSRVVITHDAETALVGGIGHRYGVVLIAGTGAIAYGVNADGEARRTDGWGYLIGDEGSARWIGVQGLRAVARAHDGRGPATELTERILSHVCLEDAYQLVTVVYADDFGVPKLAGLAPLVSQAAQAGDTVAQEILRQAGLRLSRSMRAVIDGLKMTDATFEVVLLGGVLRAGDLVRKTVVAELGQIAPCARVVEPRRDAAVGAALLAMQAGEWLVEHKEESVPITEARNQQTTAIDTLSSIEIVTLINDEDLKVATAVRGELPQIARAVDIVVERLKQGGRLFYLGAGTSGRLGVLDASEMPPTYGTPPELVQGFIAGGDVALRRSVEAAEDNPEEGARVVRSAYVTEGDVVVGITASGEAPWVLGAIQEARRCGAATVALTCNPRSALARACDVTIAPVVGPEVIAGSSRMKAGTAQKMVLNMLSTTTMIRLGKVYGNLMVDVQPTNAKLRRRALHILQDASGADAESARAALEATDYDVKTSLVMLLTGADSNEARRRLDAADGFVRRASV